MPKKIDPPAARGACDSCESTSRNTPDRRPGCPDCDGHRHQCGGRSGAPPGRKLSDLRTWRETLHAQLEAHPLHPVLHSIAAVGIRTEARILTEVGGKDFPTAGLLASQAGLSPVTWRSVSSIRGDHSSRTGNKILLKRALFLSSFAALKDPPSRAYYDRKRAAGKKHNLALIALARRRCDVIYVMLRDGTL